MLTKLSEEAILEKVRLEKFRDSLTAGKLWAMNAWDMYCFLARGIMGALSPGFQQDNNTSLDFFVITRVNGFQIHGYIAINTSAGREVIRYEWDVQ